MLDTISIISTGSRHKGKRKRRKRSDNCNDSYPLLQNPQGKRCLGAVVLAVWRFHSLSETDSGQDSSCIFKRV